MPSGWIVTATERTAAGDGYRFESFDSSDPYQALGRLRTKVRRHLATKYLRPGPELELSHDRAFGRITWDSAEDEVMMVIDGRSVSLQELARLLSTYEGWQFQLRMIDPCSGDEP